MESSSLIFDLTCPVRKVKISVNILTCIKLVIKIKSEKDKALNLS